MLSAGRLRAPRGVTMIVAADVAAVVLVCVVTALVVVVVVGLHVWGALQDGREEKEMRASRHPEE